MRFGQCAGNGGERRQMPSMRLGPRRAFVDHAEQGRWPKRLAQAARRAKFLSHSQEVGGETLGSTIGDRDPKAIPLEPSANGQTDMRIVIDYQNAAHSNFPHVLVRSTDPRIDRTMIFAAANQRVILISAAKSLIRLPCSVYRPCYAADRLAQLTHHIMSFSPVTSHTSQYTGDERQIELPPFRQECLCVRVSIRVIFCCKRCPRQNSKRCGRGWNWSSWSRTLSWSKLALPRRMSICRTAGSSR